MKKVLCALTFIAPFAALAAPQLPVAGKYYAVIDGVTFCETLFDVNANGFHIGDEFNHNLIICAVTYKQDKNVNGIRQNKFRCTTEFYQNNDLFLSFFSGLAGTYSASTVKITAGSDEVEVGTAGSSPRDILLHKPITFKRDTNGSRCAE